MEIKNDKRRIALIGGGPSGLFMLKRLVDSGRSDFDITIFERKSQPGAGMPYSKEGASDEHITNVSANEIPMMVTPVSEWLCTVPAATLEHVGIDANHFNEYKVLPRLLFGQYLTAQFEMLQELAQQKGITVHLLLETTVTNITNIPKASEIIVETENQKHPFDSVVICTGHQWPRKFEGKVSQYFDSPYPPSKLALHCNHAVAIRGASLTAIDAIRTLARHNGRFVKNTQGDLAYERHPTSEDFKIVMHSRSGLLPAVRFHLEDTHLKQDELLTPEAIAEHRKANDGFLSLDFLFEKDFKALFRDKDPEFYARIKDMDIETFVDTMMELRERLDPFVLLRAEYAEAEKSIKRQQSVYWKEMLAVLSFAMNYPAKYMSAEDMLRLQKVLMPLISIVIAFIPQASCKELLALHDAGVLDMVAVGSDSTVKPVHQGGIIYEYTDEAGENHSVRYQTFVDCIGQPHLSYDDFPFAGLKNQKAISPARLQFRSNDAAKTLHDAPVEPDSQGNYYLNVPGIAINDHFQVLDQYGAYHPNIFIMAVPYIGGYNPDYSGLDFCEAASGLIAESMFDYFNDENVT